MSISPEISTPQQLLSLLDADSGHCELWETHDVGPIIWRCELFTLFQSPLGSGRRLNKFESEVGFWYSVSGDRHGVMFCPANTFRYRNIHGPTFAQILSMPETFGQAVFKLPTLERIIKPHGGLGNFLATLTAIENRVLPQIASYIASDTAEARLIVELQDRFRRTPELRHSGDTNADYGYAPGDFEFGNRYLNPAWVRAGRRR